jgi:D-glycero-alpha-D-manno-heptose-7-phosphate kinase
MGCGHNCGKQDHYAAAYGGLHFFKFLKDGSVEVEPICLDDDMVAFEDQLMLFWTGRTRSANEILKKQSISLSISKYAENTAVEMRNMAYELHAALELGGIFTLGESLHRNWELKKSLSPGITESWIDELYAKARGAGASGGKICGAGGGGFLLVCSEKEHKKAIEAAVGLRRVQIFKAEEGSKVIYG